MCISDHLGLLEGTHYFMEGLDLDYQQCGALCHRVQLDSEECQLGGGALSLLLCNQNFHSQQVLRVMVKA